MVDALILETSALVDLEREARRGAGPAMRYLARQSDALLYITPTIAGELAAGSSLGQRDRWDAFLAGFTVLPLTADVCWEYGRAFRYLQENGQLIGANDLWIAAAAIAHGMPLVTRDVRGVPSRPRAHRGGLRVRTVRAGRPAARPLWRGRGSYASPMSSFQTSG